MKKRVPMFMLYVIITTVLIYFSKRTADVFSYAGFLFDDVPQLKYGMLSVIIFVYYFLIIRRYPLGSNFGLRTLLVHILFSFMIIPMVVYSIFSSFTPQIVIGYNVAILALDVAMCTGPVLVPKSRVRPAKFVRFVSGFLLDFNLLHIRCWYSFGVLLYIINQASSMIFIGSEVCFCQSFVNRGLCYWKLLNFSGHLCPYCYITRRNKHALWVSFHT